VEISLLAVGTRMPAWVTAGFEEYRKRLSAQLTLVLHEVPAGQRKARADAAAARRLEGDQLLRRADRADLVLALDEQGRQWSTGELADALRRWQLETPRVALLVGGPDGLDERCRQRADRLWSLSALTLPHPLVRVLIAEQIYRAWTILQGHPYHRA
jgi:23S rRNA (pseudouridine1915-N3)-methyltransferase